MPVTEPGWLTKLLALPRGYSIGLFQGKAYGLRYEVLLGERVHKFYAQELGGQDFISLNVYLTDAGPQLKPCEMPASKVTTFLELVEPRTE
jgi:hypothetical protein